MARRLPVNAKALGRRPPRSLSIAVLFITGAVAYFTRGRIKPDAPRDDARQSGRAVYLANGCAACHGASGDGRGMMGRGLNPPPTNFRDAAAYRHGRDVASLRRTIRFGLVEENSRMPAFEHLSAQELDGVAGYLISLQTK